MIVTVLVAPASTFDFNGSMVNSFECGLEVGRGSIEKSPVACCDKRRFMVYLQYIDAS